MQKIVTGRLIVATWLCRVLSPHPAIFFNGGTPSRGLSLTGWIIMKTNVEKPSLTQDVIGSDGRLSGEGGGAYRLVKSKSLNFLPINDRALSTCCCEPGRIARPN